MKYLTKWAYLAQCCEQKEYKEAVIIARKIDKELINLYGYVHTKNWLREYVLLSEQSIKDIARNTSYCIACKIHFYKCSSCKFGKLNKSACWEQQENNLYTQFVNSIK